MNNFAELYLQLLNTTKKLHQCVLHKQTIDAYLTACDVTELAQELEDILQKEAHKAKQ